MRPVPSVVGMGDAVPFLWVAGLGPNDGDEKTQESVLKSHHIAFTAESQSSILHSSSLGSFTLVSSSPAALSEFHSH